MTNKYLIAGPTAQDHQFSFDDFGFLSIDDLPVAQTLSLVYGGQGPLEVLAIGVPAGWTGEGIATMTAQLTVGQNIGSGILLDENSDAIPDGWTFMAFLFVEGNTIYDIIAVNPWTFTGGGIVSWGDEGGAPQRLSIPGGITSVGPVVLPNLPTSDPAFAGQLWNNLGIVTVSAG